MMSFCICAIEIQLWYQIVKQQIVRWFCFGKKSWRFVNYLDVRALNVSTMYKQIFVITVIYFNVSIVGVLLWTAKIYNQKL